MENNSILYKINGITCATSTAEIDEIVQNMPLHEPPLAKQWLSGVIHLRGSIIPVTNLDLFVAEQEAGRELEHHTPSYKKRSVILIISSENWSYGIQISEVIGMQLLSESRSLEESDPSVQSYKESIPTALLKIAKGYQYIDDQYHLEVSLKALTLQEEFLNSCRI